MSKVQGIIAAGIRQYCNDLATELSADDRLGLGENRILKRLDADADSLARYIEDDGLRGNGIVGYVDRNATRVKRVYTDADAEAWYDGD